MIVRSFVTFGMWIMYLASLFLMGSSFDLGGGVIALAFVLMIPFFAAIRAMWGMGKDGSSHVIAPETSTDTEKRKRDRLDAVLRDLSDEQLAALKTRLSDPNFEDEVLYMLGDDGELLTKR